MELTRRKFGKMLAVAAIGFLTYGRWALAKGPVRFVQAVRRGLFPGRIVPLDENEVKCQSQWTG